uniref:Multimerin 2b n=1 Tax=Pygocentrus nattereri TaxID=42514 RepID=A0A3B4BYB0_PYGNA
EHLQEGRKGWTPRVHVLYCLSLLCQGPVTSYFSSSSSALSVPLSSYSSRLCLLCLSSCRNWCAFVHQRVVTMAVLCGTETYTQKSVNPCSKGDPDCHISKYQLSSRPVYRQKQKIFTALHWKCCPGHGGHNCQERDCSKCQQEKKFTAKFTVFSCINISLVFFCANKVSDYQCIVVGTGGAVPPPTALHFMDSATLLMAHQIFAALMTQIQPVLDDFNRTLKHLSSEVEDLSMDLQMLRHGQEGHMSNSKQTYTGTIEEKLEDSFMQIRQIQAQLDSQQNQMEQTVQSQQKLLQYNLTSIKEEIGHHINKSHEDIQVTHKYAPSARLSEGQRVPEPGVWEAISRLDKKVLNNTMQLSDLSENSKHLKSAAQKLDHCLKNLSTKLEQVSQSSVIHFTETGLELEAAKVAALNSVNELSSNLSSQERQLRELELYLDNIYEQVQRNEPTTTAEACSCKEISESLSLLELKLANVTDLAKKNQYALEDAEAMRGQSHWSMEVDDLHQALLSVRESLAFEQAKSRTLSGNVSQLKASLLGSQQEILGLKESFGAKAAEIGHLSASFSSLLRDTIRHAEVLEVLLGDEVMEFSSWSDTQQKELSIPVLLQKTRLMQEKIETHDNRLTSLRRSSAEKDQMTSDDPVAFSEWGLTEDKERDAEDHQVDPFVPGLSTGEDDGDYSVSDFWSLGKEVEELADRISQLEQQQCNCTAVPGGSVMELQGEVVSLRQALGDHLRIFQNLFSYTEQLASSSRSLDLDQVWSMIRRKDRKRNKGQNMKEKEESSSMRSKRNTKTGINTLVDHYYRTLYPPVAFVTSLQHRTNTGGMLIPKKVDVNHGNAYQPSSGEFYAPQTGLYLFLVTLNFEKGPCLAQLKHGMVPVASIRQVQVEGGPLSRACLLELQRGERITLELLKGRLRQGQLNDNTLSGILLFNTEEKDRL